VAPRFSVLLPTRNRSDVLPFAIESVLAQTDGDFELLIVGDGCTDDTARVVASFADDRIRWFDLPKAPGFGYANRNVALRTALGDLVAFMAHDDLQLRDHLELMGTAFNDERVMWAYSRPLWVSDDGYVVPFAVDLREPQDMETFTTHHNSIPASAVVYRRTVGDGSGLWPEDAPASGDWEMWKRIVKGDASAIAYVSEATTLHFRADWRDGSAWGPPPLHDWLDVARARRWPDELRVDIPEGGVPQEVLASILRDDGVAWTAAARSAVSAAVERLGWGASVRGHAALVDANAAVAAARAHVSELEVAVGSEQARANVGAAALREAQYRVSTLETQLAAAGSRLVETQARVSELENRVRPSKGRVPVAVRRVARRLRLRVAGNPLFDAAWYVNTYPDLGNLDARHHWRTTGHRERRNPNGWFDTAAYVAANPDVAASGMNPLDHYYAYGLLEGRSPAPRRNQPL
jgi:hypothetical protein